MTTKQIYTPVASKKLLNHIFHIFFLWFIHLFISKSLRRIFLLCRNMFERKKWKMCPSWSGYADEYILLPQFLLSAQKTFYYPFITCTPVFSKIPTHIFADILNITEHLTVKDLKNGFISNLIYSHIAGRLAPQAKEWFVVEL